MDLQHNTARPFALIRSLTVDDTYHSEPVILGAVNVETLTYTPADQLSYLSSLETHVHLKTLTLSHGDMSFSTLMDLLHSIPRLTSLTLSHVAVLDFNDTAQDVWPYEYDEDKYIGDDHFFLEGCAPLHWERYNFDDTDPLPNISHLSLDSSEVEQLMLIDFVCSPKPPFQNLRTLSLSDSTDSFMAARVDALLLKYSSSLTMFELRPYESEWHRQLSNCMLTPDTDGNLQRMFPSICMTLPSGVQHFKFFVDVNGMGKPRRSDVLYDNISSARHTLEVVTMHVSFEGPTQVVSEEMGELDRLLASLDLQRFNVQVDIRLGEVEQPDKCARDMLTSIFPLIMAKFLEGESGKIFWAYKGPKKRIVF